ncbi:hypothetical protein CK507_15950 [Pseudomonas sp. WN033]|nr:hypothetical protein CK507_15950 [Pseudomonas sp. WN033]
MRHGHQRADLGSYTRRQLTLYYERALAVDRRERAARTVDMSLAFAGGQKATDHVNTLTK